MGSRQDRDYFSRIGAAKSAAHRQARAQHLASSLDDRLQRSIELYLRHRAEARSQVDDPGAFYERARALGLYRP